MCAHTPTLTLHITAPGGRTPWTAAPWTRACSPRRAQAAVLQGSARNMLPACCPVRRATDMVSTAQGATALMTATARAGPPAATTRHPRATATTSRGLLPTGAGTTRSTSTCRASL